MLARVWKSDPSIKKIRVINFRNTLHIKEGLLEDTVRRFDGPNVPFGTRCRILDLEDNITVLVDSHVETGVCMKYCHPVRILCRLGV